MTVNDVAPGRFPARNRIRPFIVTRRNKLCPLPSSSSSPSSPPRQPN